MGKRESERNNSRAKRVLRVASRYVLQPCFLKQKRQLKLARIWCPPSEFPETAQKLVKAEFDDFHSFFSHF